MDEQRQSLSGRHGKHEYKKHDIVHSRKATSVRPRIQASLSYRTVAVAIATMVSAWFLTKVLVAFAPLTTVVYAQYNTTTDLPLLLDATGDELVAGLEAGAFTSLDLVQVCCPQFVQAWVFLGISR
jgi:amidase